MTAEQYDALEAICESYQVAFCESDFQPQFDLPRGWIGGYIGPYFVSCSSNGDLGSWDIND